MSGSGVISRLTEACAKEKGVLMLVNLDNFGLFNEIYGVEVGDALLENCVRIINEVTEGDDIKGRLGGDEFIIFCKNLEDKKEVAEMLEYINEKLEDSIDELLGEETNISLGVSIGAVHVPEYGNDYEDLFHKADTALDYVKQTGEHGCAFYEFDETQDGAGRIDDISNYMDEAGDERGALWLEYDYFSVVYKFYTRYLKTYGGVAAKMLIKVKPKVNNIGEEHFKQIVRDFGKIINVTLRKSDFMMQSGSSQFFLLLPEITEEYTDKVKRRIEKRWIDVGLNGVMDMTIESEPIIALNDKEK